MEGPSAFAIFSTLAPTDYYLLRSLLNHMRGITFDNEEDLKNWLNKFFNTRCRKFHRTALTNWLRWEEVVNSKGEHIIY